MDRHLARDLTRTTALVLAALMAVGVCTAEAPASGRDYIIGVEDQLRIAVWNEPELSTIAKVRPDGKITIPLVNDVSVAGKTPSKVREEITERLGAYVNAPLVTVIIEQINSFKIYILGNGIRQQGVFSFQQPTRLLQAVAVAGGFADFSKKEITILRERGGIEKRIVVRFKQFLAGDAPGSNLLLEPGDTLIVD